MDGGIRRRSRRTPALIKAISTLSESDLKRYNFYTTKVLARLDRPTIGGCSGEDFVAEAIARIWDGRRKGKKGQTIDDVMYGTMRSLISNALKREGLFSSLDDIELENDDDSANEADEQEG